MSFFIGATLALMVGGFATWSGFDRDRSFYPTVLLVVASYYILFAVMGASMQAILAECLVLVPFLVASLAGLRRTPWAAVVGLAAHGMLDLLHPHLLSNPGVPVWWPSFCLAYDGIAAIYFGVLLVSRGRQRTEALDPASSLSADTIARRVAPFVIPLHDTRTPSQQRSASTTFQSIGD